MNQMNPNYVKISATNGNKVCICSQCGTREKKIKFIQNVSFFVKSLEGFDENDDVDQYYLDQFISDRSGGWYDLRAELFCKKCNEITTHYTVEPELSEIIHRLAFHLNIYIDDFSYLAYMPESTDNIFIEECVRTIENSEISGFRIKISPKDDTSEESLKDFLSAVLNMPELKLLVSDYGCEQFIEYKQYTDTINEKDRDFEAYILTAQRGTSIEAAINSLKKILEIDE